MSRRQKSASKQRHHHNRYLPLLLFILIRLAFSKHLDYSACIRARNYFIRYMALEIE